MDYKNRIPGYRPPRPPRKKNRAGLWASLAAVGAMVAVAIGWAVTRPKDEPLPPKPQTTANNSVPVTLPANPPQPNPPGKTPDKKPAKVDGKELGKESTKETAKPGQPMPKPVEPPAKPPEPRFTFYKILPELEAIIPESEIKTLKHDEKLGKKPPTVKYLLQAGSFTNAQDAEKLKAKLSGLKIKSHIETVKIENAAWNRVKIGPFNNMADADRVRTYLRSNHLDSVVQKSVTKPSEQAAPPSR
jgi:cell division protein FtsN